MSFFVVAAGGTGGHMVPAHVLAMELGARGHKVALMSDARGLRFPGLFHGVEKRVVDSASIGGLNPLNWLSGLMAVARGRGDAREFMREYNVAAVIGFGGYPAVPALLAAASLGRPAILHEQNAVFGRSNRLLAGRVARIATSFAVTRRLPDKYAGKTVVIGNPVRDEVRALGQQPYAAPAAGEPLHILVTGGSQGASILSRVVPAGLALLPAEVRARLRVVHQGRPEDLENARVAYHAAGIAAEMATYLADLPERIAAAHLVVARAGASTMAELAVIGRPAILVPFAAAMDDHQTANAAEFVNAGGGPVLTETQFTPFALSQAIVSLTSSPATLENAARAAKSVGRPDAGARLADLAVALGGAA
ncbi:undecaprenyldiphospho-muramoylpentapeptide beta-N-acetylglucosaminyltransferase [Glacieibacterium sp.]|uniref:undecaprenyldiphospho-muramoylpentapeptide beta-N-acetylglucosaminyltransferase n=1 Tax=Glacieibacterium sp. TaxID=2860237 RepID=UPI003B00A645